MKIQDPDTSLSQINFYLTIPEFPHEEYDFSGRNTSKAVTRKTVLTFGGLASETVVGAEGRPRL